MAAMDEFTFQGAPKAFHHGVVMAVAASAHAGDDARFAGHPAVALAAAQPVLHGGAFEVKVVSLLADFGFRFVVHGVLFWLTRSHFGSPQNRDKATFHSVQKKLSSAVALA